MVEVNESGGVVGRVDIGLPYEAERLSTGDESAGGPTASKAGLTARLSGHPGSTGAESDSGPGLSRRAFLAARSLVPGSLVQGLAFVLPSWLSYWHVLLVVGTVIDLTVWGILELRFAGWRLRMPVARG
ncbi:MAG: hypothetical protein ABEJ40_04225 [Haloarculaceae archaeon]